MPSIRKGLILAVSLFVPAVAHAQIDPASADQVVQALAGVVKDRAKQVATNTIAYEISKGLCKDGRTVDAKWTDSNGAEQKLTLHVGGMATCHQNAADCLKSKDPKSAACTQEATACNSDDVFVQTCAEIDAHQDLTDQDFLKTFTDETAAFALRLTLEREKETEYSALGMQNVASYVVDVMSDVLTPSTAAKKILTRTGQLATDLDSMTVSGGTTSIEQNALYNVGQLPASQALSAAALAKIGALCAGGGCLADAGGAGLPAAKFFPTDLDSAIAANKTAACQAYFQGAGNALSVAKGDFSKYFVGQTPACSTTKNSDSKCKAGLLAWGLGPALAKAKCAKEDVWQPPNDIATGMRNLIHALQGDVAAYEDALDAPGVTPVNDWVNAAQPVLAATFKPEALARYEVANAIKLVVAVAQARLADQAGFTTWLTQLQSDLKNLNSASLSGGKTYEELLEGFTSLKWDNRKTLSQPVQGVRDVVKTFLLTPELVSFVKLKVNSNQDLLTLQLNLTQLLNNFGTVAQDKTVSANDVLTILQSTTSLVATTLSFAATVDTDATTAANLKLYSSILSTSSDIFAMAIDRDWVSLVKDVAHIIETADPKDDGLTRSAKFITLLASMYQAKSVADAQALFEAQLESVGSRTSRFNTTIPTVDIAALVGGLGNYQWVNAPNAAPGHAHDGQGFGGGLYAPFGLQLGFPYFGMLIYPLDLGAYLTSSLVTQASAEGTTTNGGAIALSAVRIGGAVYVRCDPNVPIDVGVGADYRPAFTGQEATRVYLFAAMELPLYLLR